MKPEDDVSSAPTPPLAKKENLPLIDALRGLCAPGVFFCHVHTPGTTVPSGAVFVDIFMAISGFLMTHHYILREEREPWNHPLTPVLFYIRRFFRIVPLYYAALLYFFVFYWGDAQQQPASIAWNIVQHVTFIFGFLPEPAWTQMPDWSLSLEMQFYFVFSLLMIWIMRMGPLPVILLSATLAWLFNASFNLYTAKLGPLGYYLQPSILPFKFTLFTMGMLTALIYWRRIRYSWLTLTMVTLGCAVPYRHGHSWFVIGVLGLSLTVHAAPRTAYLAIRCFSALNEFCRNRFFHFLAETSYAIYLIHEFVLRVVMEKIGNWLMDSPKAHWWLVCCLGLVVAYSVAYLVQYLIEKPGITLGRHICRSLVSRNVAR
jgi:peptidoglycan/LPS O-acetylase OafA/YrhL